jgi:hypothetical protein
LSFAAFFIPDKVIRLCTGTTRFPDCFYALSCFGSVQVLIPKAR